MRGQYKPVIVAAIHRYIDWDPGTEWPTAHVVGQREIYRGTAYVKARSST